VPGWVWNGSGWVWQDPAAHYPNQQQAPPQYPTQQQTPQQPAPQYQAPQYQATQYPAPPQPYPASPGNPYLNGPTGTYVPPVPGPQQQLPPSPAAQRETGRSSCLGLLAVGAIILLSVAGIIWSIVSFAVHVW
jgi:hypothetical protein